MSLVGQARNGDVVAIMTHQDRELLIGGCSITAQPETVQMCCDESPCCAR